MEKKKKQTKREKQISRGFAAINAVYRELPDTQGCMEHINKRTEQGGCGGWCCRLQNPHVLFVEFLNTWEYILKKWEWQSIHDLIERAIRNYLSQSVIKGCIFWDQNTKLCGCHTVRPYNCRIYGIVPEEEIKPRIEQLRVLYQDPNGHFIKDQCSLVSTVDGKPVTTSMTNNWWKKMTEAEESIGIKKRDIHAENSSGSYMTYHDHLLIHILPDFVMKQLQILRVHGNMEEKETAIRGIMEGFKSRLSQEGVSVAALKGIDNDQKTTSQLQEKKDTSI